MDKEMKNLKVYINEENCICIAQEDYNGEESFISIHPSQVDLVIQWLKETQQEILEMQNRN